MLIFANRYKNKAGIYMLFWILNFENQYSSIKSKIQQNIEILPACIYNLMSI